jgi:iron-sulfur cluster repair protein YtfE (RIC family)
MLIHSQAAHSAHIVALEMTHAHNSFIRNINATLLQAPSVADSTNPSRYKPEDVKDLLWFVDAWLKALDHHHFVEETIFFPSLTMLDGVSTKAFDTPVEQHKEFHDGAMELLVYCADCSRDPGEYRWSRMKEMIESFTPALVKHLTEEIEILLALEKSADSAEVMKAWKATEKAAIDSASWEEMVITLFLLVALHVY